MAKRGKEKKRTDIPKKILTEQIIDILNDNADQPFNYKQISKKLNISDES